MASCFESSVALHQIAMKYGMKDNREAYRRAMREYPALAREYNSSGEAQAVASYVVSASDRVMTLAQTDLETNQKRAGEVLDHGAQGLAGSNQRGNQVNPESYRRCMAELMQAFPDLAECYSSGRIDPQNWALLSTLIPALSGEIKRVHGVTPHNLRSGRYASNQSYRKYDNSGNEYRVYVR